MTGQAATVSVKVVPRSNKDEVAGWEGDTVKIRLKAAPTDGKANEALVRFLADQIGVAVSQVEIVTGHSSRRKIIRFRGATAERIRERLK